MDTSLFQDFREKLSANVSKVIVGKQDKVDMIMVAFICGGHVLLEDVPGLGKTKLAKTLAKSMDLQFKRVQFTPDLLPSDLTGIYFYNQKTKEFEYKEGPLLSNVVLADEINRATPRTQSALLECMEEKQMTVEGNTMKLKPPFFVIATENPVEQFGTFNLPEAQLDRFFMKLSLGYPEYFQEKMIMDIYQKLDPLENLQSVITSDEIEFVQNNYCNVHITDGIKEYILNIVRATREHRDIHLGCSPRATLAMMKGSQALAALRGRDYVIPEDVKEVAKPILSHRIILVNDAMGTSDKRDDAIDDILNAMEAPLEKI